MGSKYLDSRIQICTQTLSCRDSHYVKTKINVTLRSKHPSFSIQNLLHHYESEIQTQPCSCLNKPFHFHSGKLDQSNWAYLCAHYNSKCSFSNLAQLQDPKCSQEYFGFLEMAPQNEPPCWYFQTSLQIHLQGRMDAKQ